MACVPTGPIAPSRDRQTISIGRTVFMESSFQNTCHTSVPGIGNYDTPHLSVGCCSYKIVVANCFSICPTTHAVSKCFLFWFNTKLCLRDNRCIVYGCTALLHGLIVPDVTGPSA